MDKYITHHRFDLIAKYLYLKYNNSEFYQELYQKHIITFNQAWEEPGKKKCIEDFVRSFNEIKNSIKKYGFNIKKPITIGKNGVIINGAHRLAVCLYYKIEPEFKFSDRNGCETYHYDFFLNRNNYWKKYNKTYSNLEAMYSDVMALEYINVKTNIFPIVFYPICYKIFEKNKEKIIKIINNYGNIYYGTKKKFNKNQLKNFIKELYRGENWIGGLFPNDICGGKLDLCYSQDYTQLYLFQFNNQNDMIKMKQELRNIFNLKKNSVHIPDTLDESFRISSAFLNHNNEIFLNYDFNSEEKKKLEQLFKNFKRQDKLCWDLEKNIDVKDSKIINDPRNYFYFNGYKIKIFNKLNQNFNEDKPIINEDKPIINEDKPIINEDKPIINEDKVIIKKDTPKNNINIKFLIIGHELHSHTHSYIFYGINRALKYLNYKVDWIFKDEEINKIKNEKIHYDYIITELYYNKNIPIIKNCKYIIQQPFIELFDKNNNYKTDHFMIGLFKELPKKNILIWRPYLKKFNKNIFDSYYHNDFKIFILPSATNLLPYEVDRNISKLDTFKYKKVSNFIGVPENYNKILEQELEKNEIKYKSYNFIFNNNNNGVSMKNNEKFIQESIIAPALQTEWEIEAGYIPCRIFKNISYGKMGMTNNPTVNKLFNNKLIYSSDISEIVKKGLFFEVNTNKNKILKELMENIKEYHTYVNRINFILDNLHG